MTLRYLHFRLNVRADDTFANEREKQNDHEILRITYEKPGMFVCRQLRFHGIEFKNELPMNILPGHRWIVKVIDPVN